MPIAVLALATLVRAAPAPHQNLETFLVHVQRACASNDRGARVSADDHPALTASSVPVRDLCWRLSVAYSRQIS